VKNESFTEESQQSEESNMNSAEKAPKAERLLTSVISATPLYSNFQLKIIFWKNRFEDLAHENACLRKALEILHRGVTARNLSLQEALRRQQVLVARIDMLIHEKQHGRQQKISSNTMRMKKDNNLEAACVLSPHHSVLMTSAGISDSPCTIKSPATPPSARKAGHFGEPRAFHPMLGMCYYRSSTENNIKTEMECLERPKLEVTLEPLKSSETPKSSCSLSQTESNYSNDGDRGLHNRGNGPDLPNWQCIPGNVLDFFVPMLSI
jgi:hypothetical protein